MNTEYTDLLKFVDDALDLAQSIPRWWSKFSKKTYCNHQKLVIYVLMQKMRTTTRGIVSILRSSEELRLHLGLSRIPVHTTLVRFASRIQFLVPKMLGIRQAHTVAIDSTGFSLDNRSAHYEKVLKSQNNRKKRHYVKLSIAVKVETREIISCITHHDYTHDTNDFIPLLKGVKCNHVVADKGYDSRMLRKFVLKKVHAKPHIPHRKMTSPGRNKNTTNPPPNPKIYPKRSLVENVFFCMKQKFGSALRNRAVASQIAEVLCKVLAHNLDRKQKQLIQNLLIHLRIAPAPFSTYV